VGECLQIKLKPYLALSLVLLLSLVGVASAYVSTSGTISLYFTVGSSFMVQDTVQPENITFTVVTGTLQGSGAINTTSSGGLLMFTAATSGTIYVTAVSSGTVVTMEGATFGGVPKAFTAGNTYTIVWTYGSAPVVTPSPGPIPTATPGGTTILPSLNFDFIWIYLISGDFLGALQALFLGAFGFLDLVYGLGAMLFIVPLYLRTKSLLLISIVWMILGTFFITVMPMVSGLAVLFIALGIGGLLYRLFRGGNQ
jgi:hypothetical protein